MGVQRLRDEGRERTWARHAAIAAGVVAGIEALGLRPVAPPAHRSSTVTAAWLPDGLEWGPFNAAMRARGFVVAGGQGKAGRILRFGHMGDVGIEEMAEALTIMGETLPEFGHPADAAASAAAAGGIRGARRRRAVTERLLARPPRDHRLEPRGPLAGAARSAALGGGPREAAMVAARLAVDAALRPVRIVSSRLSPARRRPR